MQSGVSFSVTNNSSLFPLLTFIGSFIQANTQAQSYTSL